MKKTLIYLKQSDLAPKGGPYAVGYYIFKRLSSMQLDNPSFINSGGCKPAGIKSVSVIPNWLHIVMRGIKRYFRYKKALCHGGRAWVDLNAYEVVHFHSTRELFEARQSLEEYTGKVILTSHSPVPLHMELYDGLSPLEKTFLGRLYRKLIKMDEYAFNRADIIQFPCEEAEDPYINNWPEYSEIRKRRKSHYVYIPTGIPACIPKRNRNEVRKELGIPMGAFVITYVGRHNEVKGYDKLREIGSLLLKDEDIWVVVAGKEYPLTRYQHPHWIEIGWTNDAHSYISASDVFVLPNKETYFDIVMLEVLSLGKIVVASKTGGNKFFSHYNPNGVILYERTNEAVDEIRKIKEMPIVERERLGTLNKQMYESNFTSEIFVGKYLEFLNKL